MDEARSHRSGRLWGWLSLVIGTFVGFAGGLMAWDARLHNAIVANRVENPWPGYLIASLGVALAVAGVVSVVRTRGS